MIRFIFLFLLLMPTVSQGSERLDLSQWRTLPILHEGRIKPIDSFARIYLKIFSEHENIDGLNASEWLAEAIFTPEVAMTRKAFNGRDKDGKRISFNYEELAQYVQKKRKIIEPLLEVPANELTPTQENLLAFYENFILSTQLYRAMTVFLLPEEENTNLEKKLKRIIARKGKTIENYTDEEKEIATQAFYLTVLKEGGKDNVLFRVINVDGEWLSPWKSKNSSKIIPWKNMAQAYRLGDEEKWNEAVQQVTVKKPRLKTEVIFNVLSLEKISAFLYAAAILFFVFSCFIRPLLFEKIAFIGLLTGVVTNLTHIILRVTILERPPIGTLYESVLFVALTCAAGCAFMAYRQKNSNHVLLGGLSGFLLLLTAEAFSAEDTMGTLVAVLNTDFWLITHVICVTLGYGTCLLTSLTAHYYLIQKIRKKETKQIFRSIKTLSLFSLLLVTVGTILGGLWADQSWGRFWGWDPKENGALLIVLWLIWVLHGHLTNHITRMGFVMGMAFLSIIVILAWFGVNLLNVGLHSYGFISGVAWGIGLFCAFEIALILSLYFYPRIKNKLRKA